MENFLLWTVSLAGLCIDSVLEVSRYPPDVQDSSILSKIRCASLFLNITHMMQGEADLRSFSSACQFPTHFSGPQGCLYLELSIHTSSCPNANRLQIGSLTPEPRNMSRLTTQVWCTVFAIYVNPSDYYFPPYKSYAWNEKTQLISNNNELKSSTHHGSIIWYF